MITAPSAKTWIRHCYCEVTNICHIFMKVALCYRAPCSSPNGGNTSFAGPHRHSHHCCIGACHVTAFPKQEYKNSCLSCHNNWPIPVNYPIKSQLITLPYEQPRNILCSIMYVYSIKPRPHNILLVLTPPLPLSKTKPFSEKSESQIIIFCENTDTHHQRINWYLPYAISLHIYKVNIC